MVELHYISPALDWRECLWFTVMVGRSRQWNFFKGGPLVAGNKWWKLVKPRQKYLLAGVLVFTFLVLETHFWIPDLGALAWRVNAPGVSTLMLRQYSCWSGTPAATTKFSRTFSHIVSQQSSCMSETIFPAAVFTVHALFPLQLESRSSTSATVLSLSSDSHCHKSACPQLWPKVILHLDHNLLTHWFSAHYHTAVVMKLETSSPKTSVWLGCETSKSQYPFAASTFYDKAPGNHVWLIQPKHSALRQLILFVHWKACWGVGREMQLGRGCMGDLVQCDTTVLSGAMAMHEPFNSKDM